MDEYIEAQERFIAAALANDVSYLSLPCNKCVGSSTYSSAMLKCVAANTEASNKCVNKYLGKFRLQSVPALRDAFVETVIRAKNDDVWHKTVKTLMDIESLLTLPLLRAAVQTRFLPYVREIKVQYFAAKHKEEFFQMLLSADAEPIGATPHDSIARMVLQILWQDETWLLNALEQAAAADRCDLISAILDCQTCFPTAHVSKIIEQTETNNAVQFLQRLQRVHVLS